jgi:hypothetical protein
MIRRLSVSIEIQRKAAQAHGSDWQMPTATSSMDLDGSALAEPPGSPVVAAGGVAGVRAREGWFAAKLVCWPW